MSDYATHQGAALEEEARQRAQEIRATEEAAAQAATAETEISLHAQTVRVHRPGRQHDDTDKAAFQRPQLGPRR